MNYGRSARSQQSYTTKYFIIILRHNSFLLLQCILARGDHILLALRGRHPLCGTGVLSVIDTTSRPPMVKPLIADCTTEINLKTNGKQIKTSVAPSKALNDLIVKSDMN